MILLTSSQALFNLDLTLTIGALITLSAVISPVFVALINNSHIRKMKTIELKYDQYRQTILHKREIFENFLKAAGACAIYQEEKILQDFGTYYPLAYMYLPENTHDLMAELNLYVMKNNSSEIRIRVEAISKISHGLIEKEPTLQESILYKFRKRH